MVSTHTEPIYRAAMKHYGGAIGSIDMQFVNGAMYRRVVPLIAPDRDNGTVPPNAVLWLVTRLHPEFRRREKRAAEVLANKTFLREVRAWNETERYEWIDRNRRMQAIVPHELTDADLADHLRTLGEFLVDGWTRHHELHASDIGPIGDLIAHAIEWGIDPTDAMSLLQGSSPATTSVTDHGKAIADALRAGGVDPATVTSIEQIRAVPDAAEALDSYVDLFGLRLISDYDIEGLTLNELPSAVVAIVRTAATSTTRGGSAEQGRGSDLADTVPATLEGSLRSQAGNPALFDDLVQSAREAYGVRDDNGPLTWAWPAGLTRRAYQEAGARLVEGSKLHRSADVLELDVDELAALLDGATEPTADDLAERAAVREEERSLDPPDVLGPPLAQPDLKPLPPATRRVMGLILAAVSMLEPEEEAASRPHLTGLGIGNSSYTGTARVVDDVATAIKTLDPGDVLVTAWTAPSFNAVLGIAGGVVVQEGGLLCHAAVMARELDIPAVIGCAEAMTGIRDGDLVEIDPSAGRVTVLESGTSKTS
ncbi:MAG: PEP-utilizing enzyme [Acidimicrobiales bacterium]